MSDEQFQKLVDEHYQGLYRFAFSLCRAEADACDLVQQTFLRWAAKGSQLRDPAKAKTWLFTTLHREFLGGRRRQARFPHHEVESVAHELPVVEPAAVQAMSGAEVMACLGRVDELYRAPLVLFYLQDHSYKDIAEILEIPIGTVMSRLSRGKEQLRILLKENASVERPTIVPFIKPTGEERHG